GRFDTPERRAGLETRINEVTGAIAHESVRRYYDQDLKARLRNLFVPAARVAGSGIARRSPDKRAPRSGRPGFFEQAPAKLVALIERALTHPADWEAREGAAAEDVRQWWTHVLTLHRKTRTLNKELKEAERALGDEPSEQNFAWLRDVQDRLSAIDGTEASI